ncbi:MAG: fumarylacetoacetate hydrolase family protein [Anaerolineales bacterium]|nr:fumarylacetoacetate hydrolase family protein [Anaerolineales bacterium]
MKLAFFDNYRLGVIDGERVFDAQQAVQEFGQQSPQALLEMLITSWAEMAPRLASAIAGQAGQPLTAVNWCPPVPRPGQLVCAAVNYIEENRPDRGPFNAFLKATSSLLGSGGTVELPPAEATVFHFEPELALVIGKRASRIKAEEAMDYIFGYTHFMDVSARGLPGGFFLGKSWHTGGPLGPALVTADEIADPNQLNVKLWVNDNLRHDFSTSLMARHIPELLAEVTNVMALEPGDVVATGTHHEGLAPIQDGETVRVQIQGLGPALSVKVHDPLKRSW